MGTCEAPLKESRPATRRDALRRLGMQGGMLALSLPAHTGLAFAAGGTAAPGNRKARSKAGKVWTMKGSVGIDTLGTTLIHEHVLFGMIPDDLRAASVEFAVKLLNGAARVGIESVVDLSPARDIRLYQKVADQVSIKIVPSTGFYLYGRMPKAMQEMNEDQMFEHMLREVTEGIDGTKIRAGIIKVAAAKTPITQWEQSVFRAAAKVQKKTRTPIATHAIFEPRAQFDLLVNTGADPKRCFFSHIEAEFGWGGRPLEQQAEYLLSIAKEGGSLLFNNFGYEADTPWAHMVFLLRHLCDKGHANRILTSVDCNWEWKEGKVVFASDRHPESGKKTYAYMMTDAVPALLKAGFSAKEIQTFLVDNPRRFFGGE